MNLIKEKIKNGDIEQGLNIFLIEIETLIKKYHNQDELNSLRDSTINLLSGLNTINKDRILGTTDEKLYFQEQNKISKNLLFLIAKFEKLDISKFEKLTGSIYKEENLKQCLQQIINYKNNYSAEKHYTKLIKEISDFFVNNLIKESLLLEIYRLKANKYEIDFFQSNVEKRIKLKSKDKNFYDGVKIIVVEFMDRISKEISKDLKFFYDKNRIIYNDFKSNTDFIFLNDHYRVDKNLQDSIKNLFLLDNNNDDKWYDSESLVLGGAITYFVGLCTIMFAFPLTTIPTILFGFWLGPKWLGRTLMNKKLNKLIKEIEETNVLAERIANKMLENKSNSDQYQNKINELVISIVDKQIHNLESEIVRNLNNR